MHCQFQAVYIYVRDSENGSSFNNKSFASFMKELVAMALHSLLILFILKI